MTSEPLRTTSRSRPDATFRRQALTGPDPSIESDGSVDDPVGGAPAGWSPPTRRESLRQALAEIPDLGVDDSGDVVPGDDLASGYQPRTDQPDATVGRPAEAEDPSLVRTDAESEDLATRRDAVPTRGHRAPGRRRTTSAPTRPPGWRRAAFAVFLVALVVAIPVLAGTGYRLVTESTDGKLGSSGASPSEPGYEELVDSTPTAVVVQTDVDGALVGVTFMALGAGEGGGSVVFLPVDTLLVAPAFGVNRLASRFEFDRARTDEAASIVVNEVGKILNVGIDEVIEFDDQGWSNVVAPVTPFAIDNYDTLDLAGLTLEAGTVPLGADLVGPYLGALQPGEDELARIARQEQVWRGWLEAVASSEVADAVPGESTSGMGLFARTLARGTVDYRVLPGEAEAGSRRYEPDEEAVGALVAGAVPAPDPATPGSRRSVRLLNGVAAGPIPAELSREVAALDASVTVVGNGPSFGRDKTSIVYADPDQEGYARDLQAALGATGSVRLDRGAPDNLDITVVVGRDVLADIAPTAPSSDPVATTVPTTAPSLGGT